VKKTVLGKKGPQVVLAKNMTKQEFFGYMKELKALINLKWDHEMYGTPVFAYDNPHFHNLTPAMLAELGWSDADQLRPPCYSGDFMQPIEHVHSQVCTKFKKNLFTAGRPAWNLNTYEKMLQDAFDMVTPESVEKDCKRVIKLCKHVRHTDGGYAPPNMT
jgi:hypothetical protein